MNYVNFWDEICNSFQQCAQKTTCARASAPSCAQMYFLLSVTGGFYLKKSSYRK